MKYRRLTKEELREVESQFVRFLVANTVTADDWEKLKRDSPEKAEKLIDIFSEQVFQQVLERVEYLEYRSARDLKLFHCREREMEMVGLQVEGESRLDFTRNQPPEQMMQLLRLSGAGIKLLHGTKSYRAEREQELFQLMEGGARIARDGQLFHLLKSMRGSGQDKKRHP